MLAPEEPWHAGELLLPEEPPKPKGGRPPEDDETLFKVCYGGRTGIHWKALPRCTIEFNKGTMLGYSTSCARLRWGKMRAIKGSRDSGKWGMVR